MSNTFQKRKNRSATFEETFFVDMNQHPLFQENALYIHSYGESRVAPGGMTSINFNVNRLLRLYSFEYIVSGFGKLNYNGRQIPLAPGNLCMVPSIQSGTIQVEGGELFKRVITMERGTILSLLCGQGTFQENAVILLSQPERINEIYDTVKQLCSEGHPHQQFELSSQAYRLLTELGRQSGNSRKPLSLSALLALITTEPSAHYTLQNLAERCGVNIRTLNQRFHDAVGMSPIQFLIAKRMKYAKDLLLSESLPIYLVAEECGYKNSAFFSRHFKQHFGCSPQHFLRNMKG